jgi:hypothetical protein
MYAIIVKSNSGKTYVYGTFKTEEAARKYIERNIPSRGGSCEVVIFLPAL